MALHIPHSIFVQMKEDDSIESRDISILPNSKEREDGGLRFGHAPGSHRFRAG